MLGSWNMKNFLNINKEINMAILIKGEIKITKGFKTWKEMVYAQDK